jgi:cell division protein FtsL
MARTARAGAVAPRPVRRPRTRVAPPRVVPRAVRARGESLLDALLQGRAWIALVGLLLVGIVFFNVDLLRLNRSIATTSDQSEAVSRENARLRRELAGLGSSERIQKAALQRGLVLPAPGDVRYRTAAKSDGRRALANLKAPADKPAAPEIAAPTQATTPTPAPTPAPVTTPAPAAAPAPVTTPAPVTPPVAAPPAAAPPTTTSPGTG